MTQTATPDTNSVVQLIISKIAADKAKLMEMMASKDLIRDFDQQQKLLAEYQGGVQALHVLTGKVTHDGQDMTARSIDLPGVVTQETFEAQLKNLMASPASIRKPGVSPSLDAGIHRDRAN